jgi:hypothetical protein
MRQCHPFVSILSVALLCACDASTDDAESQVDAATSSASQAQPSEPVSEEPADVTAPETDSDECGAGKLDRWLNVLPIETIKAEIADAVGHNSIRYIAPDDNVTMDFSPGRLNVETGEDGRIRLFRCG